MMKITRFVAALLIMAALVPGCLTTRTDKEAAVMATLGEWKAGLETKDIPRLMETFSEDYVEWTLGDKEGVRVFYTTFAKQGYFNNMQVSLDAVEVSFKGKTAVAWPIFTRTRIGDRSYEMTLANEAGVWRITSMDVY